MARSTTAGTVDIDDSEVRRLFQKVRTSVPSMALKLLDDATDGLLEEMQEKLSQPGSGRWYPSATGVGMHRASAPGEPPAPDTTSYRESWKTGAMGPLARAVYTQDERAQTLEYGLGRIDPRPHALPVAVAYKQKFFRDIKMTAKKIESIRVL